MKRMLTRIGCILAGMAVFAPAPAQQATGTLFSGCGSLDAECRLELPFVAPLTAGHTVIVAVAAFLPGTMEPPAVRTWQRPDMAPQLLAPINLLAMSYAARPKCLHGPAGHACAVAASVQHRTSTDSCQGLHMLSIRNLTKTYANGVMALRDVSLDIPTGMFGLLGPNGAGKSTLMRTIATLQDPDSGSIHLGNIDVLADKPAARRQLGYLPQEFGVYPKEPAITMLDHFATLKGIVNAKERRETVEALLRQVNLWDVRGHKLGGFSGGMRQRFGIAQALLGDPKLIIVDEPTAGLDPEERNRFLNLLAEIGENIVVILSTHIVEDVTDLCPRMAIISRGQVLLTGEPREAMASLEGRIWRKAVQKSELARYQQDHIVLSSRLMAGQPVIHVLADTRPEEGFETIAPNLEDVYFGRLRAQAADAAVAA